MFPSQNNFNKLNRYRFIFNIEEEEEEEEEDLLQLI